MIQNHEKQVQNSSKRILWLKVCHIGLPVLLWNEGHVQERNNDKQGLKEKIHYW